MEFPVVRLLCFLEGLSRKIHQNKRRGDKGSHSLILCLETVIKAFKGPMAKTL